MKREIKFRAWDKKADNPQGEGLKGVMVCWDYLRQNDRLWRHEEKGCDIMQYTGLKDKNGKEIYESDILLWKCSKSGKTKEVNYVVDIHWRKGGHSYELTIHHKGEKWATNSSYWNEHNREIIGNIYENPELL